MYGFTVHVALYPGSAAHFSVCNTAKGSGDKVMNLTVQCGDFRTIFFFFCLVCQSLEKKGKKVYCPGLEPGTSCSQREELIVKLQWHVP